MQKKIKVGFLISYDYELLSISLPIVYDHVDEIILAVDKDRLTWAGKPFDLPNDFFSKIKANDPDNKITILEDDFHRPEITLMQNDTRERNILSEYMGKDCWNVQIDVDEYFVDFPTVAKFLRDNAFLLSKPNHNAVNIRAKWITLFKKTANGFLYIDNGEHFSFATNTIGRHSTARDLDSLKNREIYTDFVAIHHSWARKPEEVYFKIKNWSHSDDFDNEKFFKFWTEVDSTNYHDFKDFHPIYKGYWPELKYLEAKDEVDFLKKYKDQAPKVEPPKLDPHFRKKYWKNLFKFYRS